MRAAAVVFCVWVATLVGGSTACDPAGAGTTTGSTSGVHGTYETCPAGWRCGTCPDGSWWGYDPTVTDPVASTLFFDNKHPCG